MLRKIFILATLVFLLNILFYIILEEYRFQNIVIHHTATETGNYESISTTHKRWGWTDAAYHFILSNGSTNVSEGFLEASFRYRYLLPAGATRSFWCNLKCLHIAVVGNYETTQLPEKLQMSLVSAILILQHKFHIPRNRILLHRDCSGTICPGKNITKKTVFAWIKKWKGKIDPAIYRQQEKTIHSAWFSPKSIKMFFPHFIFYNLIILLTMLIIHLGIKVIVLPQKAH